ncbi:MAG TPA: nucleoside deaminase [Candidatus Onthomorpha intestinigallinarum]|uniref:tRNA-specific adenosine deaminase n=1 Tax=Candidatus Onthomorpha intestinigallinarum TaxID=2840880 RepID=A0A9D1UI32_9BACT|nr:nucleoside deaminase [Candidatus Onthomorpha intestinigallinarum]
MEVLDYDDEYFMSMALEEARFAGLEGEIPVGAVVVCGNRIIARTHNLTQRLNDPTAHAEMQAITCATEFLGGKYLTDCTMYVTLEPCVMCAGALFWSQIGKVVYGAKDEKRGASLVGRNLYHPKTQIVSGVKEKECSEIIKAFFKERRK